MELPAATKPTNANFVRVIRKNVQWIKVVTNDSIGKCSSELYSFNLLKLPPPPRAAILVYLNWYAGFLKRQQEAQVFFFLETGVKVDSKLLKGCQPIILFQDFLHTFSLGFRRSKRESSALPPAVRFRWNWVVSLYIGHVVHCAIYAARQSTYRLRLSSLW